MPHQTEPSANNATGRAYISTAEMAGAAVFLASDDASAVHGLDLIVDDGWCAI